MTAHRIKPPESCQDRSPIIITALYQDILKQDMAFSSLENTRENLRKMLPATISVLFSEILTKNTVIDHSLCRFSKTEKEKECEVTHLD